VGEGVSKRLKRLQKPETVNLWIIGYGNCHRRDDGAGRHVAEHLMPRYGAVEGVRILSLHQLGPELAEDLQAAGGIVFIDAAMRPQFRGRAWRRIRPVSDMAGVSHSLTAAALLGLTQLLYGRCPPAWMVSIQGNDFGFGDGLTQASADHAIQAASEVARVIDCCLGDSLGDMGGGSTKQASVQEIRAGSLDRAITKLNTESS
jgi:hydrogenase maturation protease